MRSLVFFAPVLLLAGAADPASGEEVDRYALERTDDGYVRLDTTTGAMSICQERGDQLVCRAAADERTAFQDEIDRLQEKLDGLEERVVKLEARPAIPETLLPSEEQVDKTMDFMEQFFHRFMGIVKDLDKEKSDPQAQPQKT